MNLNQNIFILTGAGISRESGIKTFREKDGLWDDHKIEDVCTVDAFVKNPDYVHKFYNERRKKLKDPRIKPNAGHFDLAKLENLWKGNFLLVTQNIDDLHEKAGSKNILHMHGTLDKYYCMKCFKFGKIKFDLTTSYKCINCNSIGSVRVDVVWFGEQPKHLSEIYHFLENTDLFISIGTSNNVYPAAGFIDHVLHFNKNARLIEFNIEKTNKSNLFTDSYIGPASKTVGMFLDKILMK